MKTNHSAIDPAASHRVNGPLRTFLRLGHAAAMSFAVPACLLVTATFATAGQPMFTTTPTPASQVAPFAQSQNSLNTSAASNQVMMNRLINQINQRQLQSQIISSQFSAQQPIYAPQQTITIKRGK